MPAPSPTTNPSRSLIERTARLLRLVIARRERAHGRKSAHAHGSDGRFGAARDHHVRLAALDDLEGVANGVSAGGAGSGSGFVRAFGAEAHAHVSGGKVDDGCGNKERRDASRAALEQRSSVRARSRRTRRCRSRCARPRARAFSGVISRPDMLHRFLRRGQRQVDEAPHLLELFFLDELKRVEVLDFGGDGAGEAGGIEVRDPRPRRSCRPEGSSRLHRGYCPRRRSARCQ